MVCGSTIQQVRQSRFWNMDGIIWRTLWPYICSVRHIYVVFILLTVSARRYFLQQNAAIRFGTLKALPINLKVLGIGNGLTVWRSGMPRWLRAANDLNQDPLSQYPGYIQYAQSNPYHPLVNSSVIAAANTAWSQLGGCRDQVSLLRQPSLFPNDVSCVQRRRSSRVIMWVATRSAPRPRTSATRASSTHFQGSGICITCPRRILTHTHPTLYHILTIQQ